MNIAATPSNKPRGVATGRKTRTHFQATATQPKGHAVPTTLTFGPSRTQRLFHQVPHRAPGHALGRERLISLLDHRTILG